MDCHQSDSKKLFKVFDASKRKRSRKKRDGMDDTNSVVSDDSNSGCQPIGCRLPSPKVSLQEINTSQAADIPPEARLIKRDSSPSIPPSPVEAHRTSRSPRRHRRPTRDGISLALKAGLVSTPRSISPQQEGNVALESLPQDQDSFIYAFLEEAIKKDKKRQRHARRHEERRSGRDGERDRVYDHHEQHEHRHHHRRHHDDVASREHAKSVKDESPSPGINQALLFETFVKLCSQFNDKTKNHTETVQVARTQSHKSLQCECLSKRNSYNVNNYQPTRLRSHEHSRENVITSKTRSHENICGRVRTHDNVAVLHAYPDHRISKTDSNRDYRNVYEHQKHPNKLETIRSQIHAEDEERYHCHYPANAVPTRSCIDHTGYRGRSSLNQQDYRDYDEHKEHVRRRHYEDDKRKYYDQKTSRSFDVHREGYCDNERAYRSSSRSENKEKRYDDRKYELRDVRNKRYEEREKYYEEKLLDARERHAIDVTKDHRSRRNFERIDRNSIASREDEYRDKERYSERERDSVQSVADIETSTLSGRSNYLRAVKQEISEQREAMDKMMKLWKELMRCFKGISQTQGQDKNIHETAANAQESAAAQLRLWRECMRRYETVARDVGDTDARLMEEINKQRLEMSEMATMWQECLQRYREMSNDFKNIKQQLATSESPTRVPAPPLVYAEGEGTAPPASYRLPPNYPPLPPMPVGYPSAGSPLRARASAPPWWWCGAEGFPGGGAGGGGGPPVRSPRRRSSPDSRGSRDADRDRDRERDRRHRHKDRERDDARYKEKSKPNAARSEHRRRKR